MIKHIQILTWSPTNKTKRYAIEFAKACASTWEVIDLLQEQPNQVADVVLFAFPVFAGRLPNVVVPYIKQLQGNHTKAMVMVVYGNRAYEDALLELYDLVREQGFEVRGAMALVAQHSIVNEVAQHRPDQQDLRSVREFAKAIEKNIDVEAIAKLYLPGNRPYVEKPVVPIVPEVSAQCSACGRCARECPTQAIEDSFCADPIKCISCMHCVFICPEKARYIPKEKYEAIASKLDACKRDKKENEYYIVRT